MTGRLRRPAVVFAAGGTGGHVTPALAVAERLPAGVDAHVVGCGRDVERRLLRGRRLTHHTLPADAGRHGTTPLARLRSLRAARLAAARLLDRIEPSVVVGCGGYVSIPTVQAAAGRAIPVVLMEQNVVAGRATELLAPLARELWTAFPLLEPLPRSSVLGNPTRRGFGATTALAARSLVILGGSQGARGLNEAIPAALARASLAGWTITHQAGRDVATTQRRYDEAGLPAQVVESISAMPQRLAAASLVVSRAGATTLAEVAIAGVPLVLVPHPTSVRDHQRRNAEYASRWGGAAVVEERQLISHLPGVLQPLVDDARLRRWRGLQMQRLATPTAADDIVGRLVSQFLVPAGTHSLEAAA